MLVMDISLLFNVVGMVVLGYIRFKKKLCSGQSQSSYSSFGFSDSVSNSEGI